MNIPVLHKIRETELAETIRRLPVTGRLLEIGAGTGWQAKILASRGLDVTAIDIPDSNYNSGRVWPIIDYDGVHIPADNRYFDVIFSSNTLEHIAAIDSFLIETQRVLKDEGTCIHILPTFAWRLSSALGHYLRWDRVFEELGGLLRSRTCRSVQSEGPDCRQPRQCPAGGIWRWVWRRVLPPRHGERGNLFTEHYYFTERKWRRVFEKAGFEVTGVSANHLYYTGHYLLGAKISMRTRRILSTVFGSACKIYVLRKADLSTQL